MVDRVLVATIIANILFLASGILELSFCVVVGKERDDTPNDGERATRNLLYQWFPLIAGIVNAAFTLFVSVAMIPALYSRKRGMLKIGAYMVTFCAIFTLCVAVYLWILTLRVGEEFFKTYITLEPELQGMIQTSFECCGYKNSTLPAFVTNDFCPSPAAAALIHGCQANIANFANVLMDDIFTAMFGVVGIDALFILCIACLHKDRKERDRYRHIDQKSGWL